MFRRRKAPVVPADAPPITIRRQNRRSLMMRPVPGGLEVYIPHWLNPESRQVKQFIVDALARLGEHVPAVPAERTSPDEIRAMVAHWGPVLGVQPGRVQFRDMRRKWGSCSSRGSITLNLRLTWVAPELAEYVVVHELAHLRELNHSPAFFAILDEHLPDHRVREAALQRASQTW